MYLRDGETNKNKKRRFWFHFFMFWIACVGLWLVAPPSAKEFFNSKRDFHVYEFIFSHVRTTIGFILLVGANLSSVVFYIMNLRRKKKDGFPTTTLGNDKKK